MSCLILTTTFCPVKIAGRQNSTEMQIECLKVTIDLIYLAIDDVEVIATMSVVSILIGKKNGQNSTFSTLGALENHTVRDMVEPLSNQVTWDCTWAFRNQKLIQMFRINTEDPVEGTRQITTGFRKWAERYIGNCGGQRKNQHQVRRMNRWNQKLQQHLADHLNEGSGMSTDPEIDI